ncbi:hypothetical protein K469DRAFT_188378 [Zopfia rhizophila CBS 207.26]|uniref:Uncharacterized protein n=1 Tax=Zopfia rhizophila CBS 207.26 TaxID=1314779 RepID=A0A6A6ETA4_9PEZI|nr:hypothetical protein K469DRAFT_188378 [Zopfia rhizophila CBS 207.26]
MLCILIQKYKQENAPVLDTGSLIQLIRLKTGVTPGIMHQNIIAIAILGRIILPVHSFLAIHPHSPLYTLIPRYTPSFPAIHPHSPLYTAIHPHSPLYTLIPRYTPSFPAIHPHSPLYTLIPLLFMSPP